MTTPVDLPQDREALGQEILGAFRGRIDPVEVPLAYHVGVVLVLLVMIVLPLLYLGMIFLLGYLLCLFAVHGAAWAQSGAIGSIAYETVLIVGGILLLFMVKPLFMPSERPPRPRVLTRSGEPLLFAFVDRLCEVVDAPKPVRIEVCCEVTAGAGLERSTWITEGEPMVLRLGLPLVAGLTLRQFAGVLAHELGHFSQEAGIWATHVIHRINSWFARVVFQRDVLDQWLYQACQRVGVLLYVVGFFLGVTRLILWTLMRVGVAVSSLMMRQMEYDADRYEAGVAGSEVFAFTTRRLRMLGVAWEAAMADLDEFYEEGRLGDDLPELILANVDQLPPHLLMEVEHALEQRGTRWYDTHPSDRDRIASAAAENTPGVFHLEYPASILFSDFAALSKRVTWEYYRQVLGDKIEPSQVRPVARLLDRQQAEQEAGKAVARYFQGFAGLLRPLPVRISDLVAPDDPRATIERLKSCRERMLEAGEQYRQALDCYRGADTLIVEANAAVALMQVGFWIPPDTFSRPMPTPETALSLRQEAMQRQAALRIEMDAFQQTAADRVEAALRLLCVSQIETHIDRADAKRRAIIATLPALAAIRQQSVNLLGLRTAQAALDLLAFNLQSHPKHRDLRRAIRAHGDHVVQLVHSMYRPLAAVAYPFEHGKGRLSIAQYALDQLPSQGELDEALRAAAGMFWAIHNLYLRIVGRLAVFAEEVESVLGLAPMPDPDD